jgi:hypothetical protein
MAEELGFLGVWLKSWGSRGMAEELALTQSVALSDFSASCDYVLSKRRSFSALCGAMR